VGDGADAHDASAISFAPPSGWTSDNAQDAIEEAAARGGYTPPTTEFEGFSEITAGAVTPSTGIDLIVTDITTGKTGSPDLSYNDTTGVFTVLTSGIYSFWARVSAADMDRGDAVFLGAYISTPDLFYAQRVSQPANWEIDSPSFWQYVLAVPPMYLPEDTEINFDVRFLVDTATPWLTDYYIHGQRIT
jgi:hypothetical protein